MSVTFERHSEGMRISMSETELKLLLELPQQLRDLYDNPLDEAYDRLFPRAYLDPTEEKAESEWQEFVHPDLHRQRLDALESVTSILNQAGPVGRNLVGVDLDEDTVNALLSVLNDARLILGSRIGLNDESEVRPDLDPGLYAAYQWLSYLEGDLVETLLG